MTAPLDAAVEIQIPATLREVLAKADLLAAENTALTSQISAVEKFVADAEEVFALLPDANDRDWISGLRAILTPAVAEPKDTQ